MRRTDFEAAHFDSRVNFKGHESTNGTEFRMGVSFNDAAFKERPNFKDVRFNRHLKHSGDVVFPHNLKLNEEGLPEGSHWVDFDSVDPIDSTIDLLRNQFILCSIIVILITSINHITTSTTACATMMTSCRIC